MVKGDKQHRTKTGRQSTVSFIVEKSLLNIPLLGKPFIVRTPLLGSLNIKEIIHLVSGVLIDFSTV